jgi:hypothetical protein
MTGYNRAEPFACVCYRIELRDICVYRTADTNVWEYSRIALPEMAVCLRMEDITTDWLSEFDGKLTIG